MKKDFSWSRSGAEYLRLYRVLDRKHGARRPLRMT